MVITCPSCSARYRLNPEKIKGRGAKITCPKCSHVFVVFSDGKAGEASASPPSSQPFRKDAATTTGAFKAVGISEGVADPASRSGEVRVVAPGPRSTRRAIRTIQQAPVTNLAGASQPAAPAPAKPATPPPSAPAAPAAVPGAASELDFREVGISTWKVKVSIGLVYDFSDISTLKKYLADKKVTPDDLISHNGKDWTKIGDIEDLDQHFIGVWKKAKAAADSGEAPAETKPKKKYEPKASLGGPSAEMAETVRDAMIQTGSLATTSGLATGSRAALKTGSHRAVTGTHRAKKGGKPQPESSGSNRVGIFLVIGVLAVGGAWFALNQLGGPGAVAGGSGAGAAPEVKLSAGEKEKIQDEIRRKIEEERQKKIAELEASPSADEAVEDEGDKNIADIKDRLVPVAPGSQRTAIVPPQQRPQQQPMQRYEAPNYNQQRAPQANAGASDGTTTVKQAKDPSLMYLTAGKKKLATGDYGSAIQMLNQAVSKNPSCGACFEALYEAHKAKGNPEEAARALDKARSLGVSVKASQNSAG